jgi:hypothetical protein
MESATFTRLRARSGVRAIPASTWAKLAFGALCILAVIGFVVYPTYPNYDSYYSLLWGRELLDGHKPSFVGYRHPTEHPLAVAFGAVLSILGEKADRVLILCSLASFVALCAGLYRLARLSFGALVGGVAVILLLSRFDYPFLAIRGYLDATYLALVVWAAALELTHRRRGTPVFLLLVAAAWLRPEAWVLLGVYFLWCLPGASWGRRALYAAFVVAGPAAWLLLDGWVTGDPLFSLNSTSGLAEELGRAAGISAVPSATHEFLLRLDKAPVVLAAIPGVLLGLWLAPRKSGMPLVLFLSGFGTFALVAVAGLSVIQRYLAVPALIVMIFAAVTVGGFGMLREDSRARRWWAVAAAAVVVAGGVWTAVHIDPTKLTQQLEIRGESHAALVQLLRDPRVQQGLRCGAVSVPTHKLVPDTRWILDRDRRGVVARSDPARPADRATRRGLAIVVTDRSALSLWVFTDSTVNPRWNLPPAGFERVATSPYFAAYARC